MDEPVGGTQIDAVVVPVTGVAVDSEQHERKRQLVTADPQREEADSNRNPYRGLYAAHPEPKESRM